MLFDTILTQFHAVATQRGHPNAVVRGHLRGEGVMLYIRLGPRFCGHRTFRSLVVADVEVDKALRRQGFFRLVLHRLEREALLLDLRAVVVENVINPHLRDYLLRIGYQPVGHSQDTLYREIPL